MWSWECNISPLDPLPSSAPPLWGICIKKCDRNPHPKPYIFMIRVTRQIKCLIAQGLGGVIPHPLPEVNFLMVEIHTPKPYIFMIRVTRQIKCLIAQALGVIPHPLPEVNFFMVEIPTPKPYIFMIRVNRQIKCPKILTCNSAVASRMLSRFYKYITWITLHSHYTSFYCGGGHMATCCNLVIIIIVLNKKFILKLCK